jgi:hypothetical protein
VLFHIEFSREGRWEAFGSGEGGVRGDGITALADLLDLSGGTLPAGTYRLIPAVSASTWWEFLELGEDGGILIAEEAPSWRPNRCPTERRPGGLPRVRLRPPRA